METGANTSSGMKGKLYDRNTVKGLLSNYNIMQQQLDILGNCPKDYEGEEVRLEYEKTLFCVNILSSAMGILNEKECLIIDIT